MKKNVTRGHGLLELFLAKQRCKTADNLIPPHLRKGRILDIGCGSYSLFLEHTVFNEKHGIDKMITADQIQQFRKQDIILSNLDFEKNRLRPFDSDLFDVVTMLAVFEHIEKADLDMLLKDVYRILRPGGIYIMTTPAKWTDKLLRLMAWSGLVSSAEIDEHKDAYDHRRITSLLLNAGFDGKKLRLGYFEAFMNIWAAAIK